MPAQRKNLAHKKLASTLRKSRMPRQDFASRFLRPPPAPRHLTESERAAWRRVAAAAVGVGTLSRADLVTLELLAVTLAAEAAARAVLAKDGMTTASESGTLKSHPAVKVAEAARAQAARLLDAFGLSPRGRQTVDRLPPAAAANRFTRGRPERSLDAFLAEAPEFPMPKGKHLTQ
jgi:P27 family predicted phage terminase small subunit